MNATNEAPRIPPRVPGRRRVAVSLIAAATLFAACGSDDAADAPTPDTSASSDAASPDTGGGESGALQQTGPITVEGTPLAPLESPDADVAVGTAAPVVSGEGFDGTPMSIGGPTDNATMVVFLAHWCPACNAEIPELLELEEAGSLPENLDIVAVSTAVAEDRDNYPPSEWLDEKGWVWPAMADDADATALSAYGGTSFPFIAILDADGNVLARRGGQASAEVTLEFINDALA